MARGEADRDRTLQALLRSIYNRLNRLERPVTLRLGGVGGAVGGMGYTLSVNSSQELVATSDSGTVTVLASP